MQQQIIKVNSGFMSFNINIVKPDIKRGILFKIFINIKKQAAAIKKFITILNRFAITAICPAFICATKTNNRKSNRRK